MNYCVRWKVGAYIAKHLEVWYIFIDRERMECLL